MSAPRRIGQAGLDLIKKWEKFRPTPYPDQAGHLTIGYGHKILPGEVFVTVTEAQAHDLLLRDLGPVERGLAQAIEVPVTDNEFDAVCSLAFNIGAGAIVRSTLVRLMNEDDFTAAACQFTRWIYITVNGKKVVSEGLLNRRHAEQELFLTA